MSKHDDGGPAFPTHGSMGEVTHEGMTLRDYFAAKELASIHDKALCTAPEVYERYADHCYRMADAMLAARGENDGR